MKISYLIFLAICLPLLLWQSCKSGDSEVDEMAQVIEKLSGTWHVNSAVIDNSDVTSDFSSFTLNIDEQLGFTTNSSTLGRSPNPWPASGLFTFGGTPASPDLNQLIREDGLAIFITLSESGDVLMMSFNFASDNTDSTEGRIAAINGDWEFAFEK